MPRFPDRTAAPRLLTSDFSLLTSHFQPRRLLPPGVIPVAMRLVPGPPAGHTTITRPLKHTLACCGLWHTAATIKKVPSRPDAGWFRQPAFDVRLTPSPDRPQSLQHPERLNLIPQITCAFRRFVIPLQPCPRTVAQRIAPTARAFRVGLSVPGNSVPAT
ncbi:MAG: hypothetical protein RLZZ436_4277 [Planctomycetota bacterium]|jgi:hypothetical protein